ncbi:myelin-oligodendrocyte glycoprotein isoform X3 [Panthera pardus]|uniref:Myelin-oligodendrocyte glycoprotein isoform X3 n=1 Tax=Panthera pardus TaxID=9691 RepID=A0A9W2VQZ6_PANPR|nr:myelin-oligodendrocyte glycoprotein isoform X3 [Panthera pardus]
MASAWSSPPPSLPSLLLLLLQLSFSYAGQFRVIGPGHPIRALVGDEAELPCRMHPGKNATGMEVGWYRPPFSRVVHLYRNGRDQDAEQAPEYRGRTELLKDNMGEGKVTLRIRKVRFSDEGGFTCFFRDHSYQEEAAMELKVEDLAGPRLPLPAAQTERQEVALDLQSDSPEGPRGLGTENLPSGGGSTVKPGPPPSPAARGERGPVQCQRRH